ncbi:MAG: alpha/beta fold hydrolase [Sphingomonadaceae bacterium]
MLVHGGGHGGWCYKPVASLLRQQGHEVYAPTLTGLADRKHLLSPDLGLDTHFADVANLIEFEDLSEVILVGHSYGGMVITGAADRVGNRIAQLVFLDGAIPLNGEALVDVSPGLLALAGTTRTVDGVELGLWPDEAATMIYGLNGCQYEQWAMARLTPHPWKTVLDPLFLTNPDAVAALPRTIINCPASLANRPDTIRSRWSKAERVWEIDTGHDLMLTEPEETARMLHLLTG